VTYTWSFGDGSAAHGQTVSHTYAGESPYTAIVTATNDTNAAQAESIAVVAPWRVYLPLVLRGP
jgi:PKD repeat protein